VVAKLPTDSPLTWRWRATGYFGRVWQYTDGLGEVDICEF